MKTDYLHKVNSPADIRGLSISQLEELCQEIRDYIIETISETGGHLAPSLGAVEVAVGLHYALDTPADRLIWDVGHQAYSHKIITGRRDALKTIRQAGGISGFCKRSESEYDAFGAGHASTSISAAVGIARARDLQNKDYRVAAIIGDGSLTGGLAYEGFNNAGELGSQFMVVLNDNEMSISPNVGAISSYLTRVVTNPVYNRFRDELWKVLGKFPRGSDKLRFAAKRFEESLKSFLTPGILFEQLGFRYFGPIDGNDLNEIIPILQRIRDIRTPVVLHLLTKKGKGMESAEINPVKYHGIGPLKPKETVNTEKPAGPLDISYNTVFGTVCTELMDRHPRMLVISAAMVEGTGLVTFEEKYPQRLSDVGIAEGHAVTYAGGLAAEGERPVVAVYSTFMQRAYDNILHDIALQNLPVVFALDRAGVVGEDGPTHHGVLDLSYMATIPGMVVSAPKDGDELRNLLHTALSQNDHPFSIRYPKDSCVQFHPGKKPVTIPIGQWEVVTEGTRIAILAVGSEVRHSLEAVSQMVKRPTVVNARFVKPLDINLLKTLAKSHSVFLTVEENSEVGGFGMTIRNECHRLNLPVQVVSLAIPDRFVEQGTRSLLLNQLGLDTGGIRKTVVTLRKRLRDTR